MIPFENQYSKYNLKYTIAVQICTGMICSIVGPDPGHVADISALQNSELFAVVLDNEELILADKGYQGLASCLTSFKGSCLHPTEEAFNVVLSSVRQIVECVLHRVKIFGILGT